MADLAPRNTPLIDLLADGVIPWQALDDAVVASHVMAPPTSFFEAEDYAGELADIEHLTEMVGGGIARSDIMDAITVQTQMRMNHA